MTGPEPMVREAYADGLRSVLAEANEAMRLQAHELGREALICGVSVLDLVALHHEALTRLGDEGLRFDRARLDRAAEFLAESLSPFEMALGGFRAANAQLLDMNERLSEAKAATELANRELEAFSYSVAHDLRAPLRSIDGFSQALLEDCGELLDETGKLHLRYVREAAQDMAALIDGLLSLSRVTRSELRREAVDLGEIGRQILAQLQRSAPQRVIDAVIGKDLVVQGDPGLLRGALENLLGNAWKFTRNNARASIELGKIAVDGEVAYFVRDNGAGFDMAYAGKLFGAFQRLHSVGEFEGTGIGLATVHRIVTRHGGRIWAEGAVGRGAVFYFTLRSGVDGR